MTCTDKAKNLMASAALLAGMLIAAPADAQTRDHAPVGLSSAQQLAQDAAGKEAWTYVNPGANFLKYRTVIIEPTTVYNGPDAQFENIDQADRIAYAEILTRALQSEIAPAFPAPATPRDDTLRVRTSIVGVQRTVGGIATATRATPMGLGLSAAKSLLGKQGTFTGSVLLAVEAYDAKTGDLVLAGIRRRTPDPLDIPATLSTMNTVKAVARDFAVSARKRLEAMTQAPAGR